MTPRAVQRAAAAARAAGALAAEAFERAAMTRIVLLGPVGRVLEAMRLEEGICVRAWVDAGRSAKFGFASSAGIDRAEEVGKAAAAQAWSAGGHAAVEPPEPKSRRGRARKGKELVPLPEPDPEPVASVAAAAAATAAPGDETRFDPEVVRLPISEARSRLRRLAEVSGVAQRPGVSPAARAELRLAAIEQTLLRRDGSSAADRLTVVSLHLRFPTVFGLASVAIASRRLADLDAAPLVPMLAAYPGREAPVARLRIRPGAAGEFDLWVAGPVAAVAALLIAERAIQRGRPVPLDGEVRLLDDPLVPWGPGSQSADADGQPVSARLLAGPAAECEAAPAPSWLVTRSSARRPPTAGPTNLVVEGLRSGGRVASTRRLHLLEAVLPAQGGLLVRGVLRRDGEDDRPVLALIEEPIEALFGAESRAATPPAFYAAGAFVRTPALLRPGVQVL